MNNGMPVFYPVGVSPGELAAQNIALRTELEKHKSMGTALPVEVQLAFALMTRFQDVTGPANEGSQREPHIVNREPSVDELLALGSACELLADYFDRHNKKKAAARPAPAAQPAWKEIED